MLVAEGNLESTQGGRMGLNAGGWGGGAVNWRVGGGMGSRASWSFGIGKQRVDKGSNLNLAHAHIQVIW